MSTAITSRIPDRCCHCRAERIGIQENRVIFRCGSVCIMGLRWRLKLACAWRTA